MMSSSAVTFGRKASAQKMSPMHTPTRRAAIPVISTMETLLEYVVLGTVAKSPERRLPRPSAATAPWTAR